jgi:phage-related protein
MNKATDSTKGTGLAYAKLGVEVKNADGSYRNSEKVMYDVINALSKVENETEKAGLAQELLGKTYTDLGSILQNGTADLEAYGQEMADLGLIMSEDVLKKNVELNDQFDKVKRNSKGLFGAVGTEINQLLLPMMEKLNEVLAKVINWFQGLTAEQKQLIFIVLAVVAGLAPLLLIIGQISSGIGGAMTSIKALNVAMNGTLLPVTLVVAAIAGLIAIFASLYKSNDEFRENVDATWLKIKKIYQDTIKVISDLIKKWLDDFKLWWAENGEAIIEKTTQIWEDIKQAFIIAFDFLIKTFNKFKEEFQKFWAEHGEEIKAIWSRIWEFMEKSFNNFIDGIKAIFKIFKGLFNSDWKLMQEGLVELWNAFWKQVGNIVSLAWDTLKLAFKVLWNAISKWFLDLVDDVKEWGKNLIQGWVDGILDTWNSLKKKVSGIADTVTGWFSGGKSKSEIQLNTVGRSILDTSSLSRFNSRNNDMIQQRQQQPVNIIQNFYTNNLDTRQMQRESARQFDNIMAARTY